MKTLPRILLIEPDPAGFHVFSRFKMPRLGLPLLGAILKQTGYEVLIHIGTPTRQEMQAYGVFDIVGISTTTSTALEAYRIAGQFRKRRKTVIIGGVHATFLPDEALQYADYVVRGESEYTLPDLLTCIQSGLQPEKIPGVSYHSSSGVVHNPNSPLIQDLDRFPFPDFSLLSPGAKLFDIPIQTSRGCPFPCNFCSVTKMFGRKVRFRSVSHVIEELKQIPKPEVFFYDDNFCAKPAYTKALLEEVLRQKINLQFFSAQVRADVTEDPEMMRLLASANCKQVYVGFESINPETLQEYDKRQTVEEIARSMEIFRNHKIRVHGMFVIGSDHDTPTTIWDTLRFARKHHIDTVQFMMLTPLPGTEFFSELDNQKRILSRDWSLYDGHRAVFIPRKMSPVTMQKNTIAAMSRFYSWFAALRAAMKLNRFQLSRSLMGWYIIQRWKWQNRGWIQRLRSLSLKAQRARMNWRLQEIQRKLEDAIRVIRSGAPDLQNRVEELRLQLEGCYEDINRSARNLTTALEKDLRRMDQHIDDLTISANRILKEL